MCLELSALSKRSMVEVCMTSEQTRPGENPDHGSHWPSTIASLAVGAAFFSLWFWLLPSWLGFRAAAVAEAPWRWIAAIPSVLGFAVAIRCVWDFGRTGHGTPAPVAPPTKLVVVGFYRYVRNPMYVGFLIGWLGLWFIFGRADLAVIGVVCLVALGVDLFVMFYEEPHLRELFGAEYDEYCRNVPRWLPRLRPWEH
jgi:protein-S-isoprenylcysteine O-methyltransferase Ste14